MPSFWLHIRVWNFSYRNPNRIKFDLLKTFNSNKFDLIVERHRQFTYGQFRAEMFEQRTCLTREKLHSHILLTSLSINAFHIISSLYIRLDQVILRSVK